MLEGSTWSRTRSFRALLRHPPEVRKGQWRKPRRGSPETLNNGYHSLLDVETPVGQLMPITVVTGLPVRRLDPLDLHSEEV